MRILLLLFGNDDHRQYTYLYSVQYVRAYSAHTDYSRVSNPVQEIIKVLIPVDVITGGGGGGSSIRRYRLGYCIFLLLLFFVFFSFILWHDRPSYSLWYFPS